MAVSGNAIADAAYAVRGAPFAWGGSDPTGFDGAGLVRHAYAQAGLDVPGQVWNLVTVGDSVPVSKLQPGDLVFFSRDANGAQSDQVGVYTHSGRFVHIPGPGEKVQVSSLADPHYMDRLTETRRMPGVQTAYPTSVGA